MDLTSYERVLIKNSWTLLKAEAGISNHLIFYESFFKIAPEAKKFFVKKNGREMDFKKLTKKFTYTMDFLVNNVERYEEVSSEITDLGSLHKRLEIDPEYYILFNQSIIHLLDELLGPRATNELKIAWTKALKFIADEMQKAPIRETNHFQRLLNKLFGNH